MKDPFKTQKMKAVRPLEDVPEPSQPFPSAPRALGAPPSCPSTSARFQPPSSDSSWTTEAGMAERTTEPELAVPAPMGKERATLTFITGFSAGKVFALDGKTHVIGRGAETDVWIEDASVSREHARISSLPDGGFLIEDLDSTNGTFVRGQKVKAQRLADGDSVQLGPTHVLRFAITEDVEEELQRRLYESSTRDALTRVYNRKYFLERLGAEVAHSHRHRVKLAVLMLDVDEFKRLNDTFGHLVGDMVLRMVSSQISRQIRAEDVLARYGGEEFVILARSTGRTEACQLAERIRAAVAGITAPDLGAPSLMVTVSIGVATLADAGVLTSPAEFLDLADKRMYRAKAGGRNQVCSDDGGQ